MQYRWSRSTLETDRTVLARHRFASHFNAFRLVTAPPPVNDFAVNAFLRSSAGFHPLRPARRSVIAP